MLLRDHDSGISFDSRNVKNLNILYCVSSNNLINCSLMWTTTATRRPIRQFSEPRRERVKDDSE